MGEQKDTSINQWSMSRLNTYEECPRRAFLAYVKKIPEPDRGQPPLDKYPTGEWPHERGDRVHRELEAFVRGLGDLPKEAEHFRPSLEGLRNLYAEDSNQVILEEMWGLTKTWEPCDPFGETVWARLKMDAMVLSGDTGLAIDYKTGKRKFNEIKHGEQLILYVISAFIKYKQLDKIVGELWYIDQKEIHRREYTRSQAMHFIKNFDIRAHTMCEDEDFTPKPSTWNCRFCPYGPGENKTNDCPVGIEV